MDLWASTSPCPFAFTASDSQGRELVLSARAWAAVSSGPSPFVYTASHTCVFRFWKRAQDSLIVFTILDDASPKVLRLALFPSGRGENTTCHLNGKRLGFL